jgi:hypothetical protein
MILVLKTCHQPIPPAARVVISLSVLAQIGAPVCQELAKTKRDSDAIYGRDSTLVILSQCGMKPALVIKHGELCYQFATASSVATEN